jgi:hypothetical protein
MAQESGELPAGKLFVDWQVTLLPARLSNLVRWEHSDSSQEFRVIEYSLFPQLYAPSESTTTLANVSPN